MSASSFPKKDVIFISALSWELSTPANEVCTINVYVCVIIKSRWGVGRLYVLVCVCVLNP